MNKKMKLCLLSTLLIFMISSGPLLAFAAPDISAEPAALGGPAEMKITVIEDEAIERENPDDNNYANNHRGGLWVGYDGGIMTRTWLKFNLANIPQEIGIAGASLNVYLNDEFNTADLPIGVHYAANDTWDETTLTWNLQTPFDASPLDVIDSPATPDMFVMGNWYSWDVTTAFVNSLNTDKGLSFVMKQIDEVSTTITWKYFLDEDYNATATLYGAYLSVDYTTPDAVDLTVDGFSSPPLSNYVQDSTPTFEWGMSDSGTGEHQRDYELEVWNNAHYNDTLLWTEEHTDYMVVHDSSTGANYAPFGYAAEMRYQMKYPSSLMSRSGVVDKLQFEIVTTPGEIVLENLQINMACVENALDLTTDFAANYDGVQSITVLNTPSYTALVVNNRITIDIENIFYLNHDLNLIVELRFTNNTGTISTTTRTLASGGSVAYSYGPGDYYSTTASVSDDRMNTLEVYFESDKIWDPATGVGNYYPFGTDNGYGGRFQTKYNKSMITETGVIDKIWFPVNQFSEEMVFENLLIRMAESPKEGGLFYDDFAFNYAGATPVTVLNRATYHVRNVGNAAVIDLDNVFRYTGEYDLLIDLQWTNRTGDILHVIRDMDAGGYRAYNLTYGSTNVAGNDTRTTHMLIDFTHSESSVEYDGIALVNATTYYWRVRTCDSTGIWSDWTNHQFKYEELSSVPEFDAPIANPAPVFIEDPVTVSINVTYFLGIHEVLLEFGGS
ncbi:MAG: CBM96 family carbohydrate-binding protein, partial [Candidatus Thorarchaeota archaeon]